MLSQTVEYALRAMTHLASLPEGQAANSETIADHTRVPKGYLSKVLRDLVIAELITSQRGPNGGFTLARAPGDVSILDVVNAVDPIKRITKCPLGNPAHINLCPLHKKLDQSIASIERDFASTSLTELVATSAQTRGQCGHLTAPAARRGRN